MTAAAEPGQDQAPTTVSGTPEQAPQVLLGQFAHELSLLVRADLELAAAQRLPHIRRIVEELGALIGVAIAFVFILAALSWAAVRGLSPSLSGWRAPLVVAGVWALIGGALLRLEHPRGLARRLHPENHRVLREQAEQARDEAERDARATAGRLAKALMRETSRREIQAGESFVEREAAAGEAELRDLFRELVDALTAPGRTGIALLERLVGADSAKR